MQRMCLFLFALMTDKITFPLKYCDTICQCRSVRSGVSKTQFTKSVHDYKTVD